MEPQQYTYIHIPTCLHLLFQIAVKLPLRNYSVRVTDFSIPSVFMAPDSHAPGLSRRVLRPIFRPPETHGTLEDKVRKSRQQLHLRAGAVKVAAKFEAMWK